MTRTRMAGVVVAVAVGAAAVIAALVGTDASGSGHASSSFAWFKPASAPAGWTVARAVGGAALAYPPGWAAIKTDPGTVSAAPLGGGSRIQAYLNATPQSGAETSANWRRFRPQHNREEGERRVRLLGGASNLPFRSGPGSCVIDSYITSKAAYREIACLVAGAGASAVVVAAAPSALWSRQAATLERAVSSFRA